MLLLILIGLTYVGASNILFIDAGLDKVDIDSFARSLSLNDEYYVLRVSISEMCGEWNEETSTFDINNYDIIVCGSRGVTILSLLLHRNNNDWSGNAIVFSPILIQCALFSFNLDENFENYEKGLNILLNIWYKSHVNIFVGIGDSIDEQMLIYDPLIEILESNPEFTQRITLRQFHGEHDWFSTINESQFDEIRSFLTTSNTCD